MAMHRDSDRARRWRGSRRAGRHLLRHWRRLRAWLRGRDVACVVMVATAVVFAGTGVAAAYFSTAGSGTGTATTGTLNPPTSVSGAQSAGTGNVTVSWTAPTGTPAATGYYVLRTDSSNAAAPACASSPASPITAVTCVDHSVPLGAYSYTVVAVYRTWTSTSAPSASVNVVASAQSVTITSTPATPTFGGTYTVVASGGGSDNAITFSGTAGVCTTGAPTTATSATVSFVGAGSCTLTASQAGSTYYLPGSGTQSFTVAKAAQTITFSAAPTNATVGGATYTPTATSTSGTAVTLSVDAASSAVCAMNGSGIVSFTGAGTCTIDASVAASANYSAATATQSFTVAQGTVLNGAALCFVQVGTNTCVASAAIGTANSGKGGTGGTFTGFVRLLDSNGKALNANAQATVALTVTTSNHLGTPIPASVIIPLGSSDSSQFTIGFTDNGAQDSGTLTATAGALSGSITLTVK